MVGLHHSIKNETLTDAETLICPIDNVLSDESEGPPVSCTEF